VVKCVFDLRERTGWRSELGQVTGSCLWRTACYLGTFIDGGSIVIAALRCDPSHDPSPECYLVDEICLHLRAAISVVCIFPGDACGWLALRSLSHSLGTSQSFRGALMISNENVAVAA
jgi:hypothetical protein